MALATMQKMKAKVCLVGEAAVGKTSLIRRFVMNEFDDRYISTLGAKVSKKEIVVDPGNNVGRVWVDMTVWDIMGEKGFRELLKEAYFHGAQGILAVCDVTRKDTLNDLADWIAAVRKVAGDVAVVIIGNKADLENMVEVTEADLAKAAQAHRATFLFASAKVGTNVGPAFETIAANIAGRQLKA